MSSSRSASNPYARRPTDDLRTDDRRFSGEYGRSSSDSRKDDRHRERDRDRDRDRVGDRGDNNSPRERDRDGSYNSDLSRDAIRLPPPNSSKLDANLNRSPKSSSTLTIAVQDGSKIAGPVAKWLTNNVDLISQLSALTNRRAALDKALEHRRLDLKETKSKHAEFPAVPELQNRYRVRDEKLRLEICQEEKKLRDKLAEALENLPPGVRPAAEPQENPQHQATHKEIESKLATLTSGLKQVQDGSSKDISRLDAQLAEQLAEQQQKIELALANQRDVFTEELRQQRENVQQEIRQQSDLHRQQLQQQQDAHQKEMEQQQEAFRNEMQQQYKAFKKQVQDLMGSHEITIKKQHMKVLDELGQKDKDMKSNLERYREQLLTEKLVKLPDDQIALLRKENENLQSANGSLVANVASLLEKVGALQTRADDHNLEVRNLASSLAACEKEVEGHRDKLILLDMEALEDISEGWSLEFPRFKTGLKAVQEQVAVLETTVSANKTKLEEEIKQVHNFVDQVVFPEVGTWVDGLRKTDSDQGSQLGELKEQVKDLREQLGVLRKSTPDSRLPAKEHLTPADVAPLKQEYTTLSAQMKAIDQRLAEAVELFNHNFRVLDSRYNNLTTKELAERMLGQLEQIYPEARIVKAKMEQVGSRADESLKRLALLEDELRDNKKRVAKIEAIFAKPIAELTEQGSHYAAGADVSFSRKRPRKDSSPNGISHAAANGILYAPVTGGSLMQ